jgi:hypothetical protein
MGGVNGWKTWPGQIASLVRSVYWKSLKLSTRSGGNGP